MIKTPVRGMRDILASDMLIRDYLLDIIQTTALSAGYQKIETPAIEHLENLSSKQGGENESLIFKILKRGRSLETALKTGDELTDSALRYDLTVPLSRLFADNSDKLVVPFKALQIGPVWRADAPQKGRFRQLVQCDMDILGDKTILAEVDILTTALKILSRICRESGITSLTIHLNDRRILQAAAEYAGFKEIDFSSIFILLDKNDKIGFDGVKAEMIRSGFDSTMVEKFIKLFETNQTSALTQFKQALNQSKVAQQAILDLEQIIAILQSCQFANVKIVFDPTIVRGMSYYTGTIFECTADGLNSSVAGGGRYDKMISKFSGQEVSACGFSIGFERITTILEDKKFTPPHQPSKLAILVGQKVKPSDYQAILQRAEKLRQADQVVTVLAMARNVGRQIEMLEKAGYNQFEKKYGN